MNIALLHPTAESEALRTCARAPMMIETLREEALGFHGEVSRTLIELAEALDAEAAEMGAEPIEKAD